MTEPKRRGRKPKPARVATLRQLEVEVGVSRTQLQKDSRRDGFPVRGTDGKWPVAEVKAWYRKSRGEPEPAGYRDGDTLREWSTRYRAAKAQKEELELAKLRGELMDTATHRRLVSDVGSAWARALRLRGRRLAASLVGLDFAGIKARLDADAESMLATFAGSQTLDEAVRKVEEQEGGADDVAEGVDGGQGDGGVGAESA